MIDSPLRLGGLMLFIARPLPADSVILCDGKSLALGHKNVTCIKITADKINPPPPRRDKRREVLLHI